MKSERLKNDLVIILITSFILIVCWIGFNIYNKSVSSTIDDTLAKEILPIPPNFDTTTIDNLKRRQKVSPLFTLTQSEEASESAPIPSPKPTPRVLPIVPSVTPLPTDTTQTQTFDAVPDASGEADITP